MVGMRTCDMERTLELLNIQSLNGVYSYMTEKKRCNSLVYYSKSFRKM